jgi:hypothetical protein
MNTRLPFVTWIALGFAAALLFAIGAAHYFAEPATAFMPAFWWNFDLLGLAFSTGLWFAKVRRPTTPKANDAELMKQSTAQSERIARALNQA